MSDDTPLARARAFVEETLKHPYSKYPGTGFSIPVEHLRALLDATAPITDEQVVAAARALYEERTDETDWHSLASSFRASCMPEARAALEAARGA